MDSVLDGVETLGNKVPHPVMMFVYLIVFLIILVGGLSSVASNAGYLILIPLAAAAFASLGRNPIAGLAAGFAGVAATFAVNIIIQPIDAMLGEMTNEAIGLTGGAPQ